MLQLIRATIVTVVLLFVVNMAQSQPNLKTPLLQPSIIDNPAQGKVFISPMGQAGFLEIADDAGQLAFSIRAQLPMIDFKVQPGNRLSYFSPDSNGFVVLDSKYHWITTLRPIGPYSIDVHEFMILPDEHYLFMAYDTIHNYDLGTQGGVVTVIGVVIQELDQTHHLVFQWRGFDEGHFLPTDMQHIESVTNMEMDAIHANSLDVDSVGNILLSSRHLSEITKIDHKTGDIIWRMGGKNNQFTFIGDSLAFSYQHSARFVNGDRILLFDNGNDRPNHFSRAVEYRIDEQAHTATLVWQFQHDQTVKSTAMGGVQRLPNGNTLIGWGATQMPGPAVTEVTPDGHVVYEAALPLGYVSYRAFRFPWGDIESVARFLNPDIAVSYVTPNPAADLASISVLPQKSGHISIAVYSTTGELMTSLCDHVLPLGQSTFELNLQSWPKGTYRIVTTSDAGSVVRSLVH